MNLCARDTDSLSPRTQRHSVPSLSVVGNRGRKKKKKALSYLPKGIALLMPGGLVFPFYSLPHAVSEHPAFFHQLLILIQRKPSGLHNRIFFFFLPSLPVALSAIPPTHVSLHFALFSINCASRTKGAPMLSQIGVEMGLSEIDKFHPRGDR